MTFGKVYTKCPQLVGFV